MIADISASCSIGDNGLTADLRYPPLNSSLGPVQSKSFRPTKPTVALQVCPVTRQITIHTEPFTVPARHTPIKAREGPLSPPQTLSGHTAANPNPSKTVIKIATTATTPIAPVFEVDPAEPPPLLQSMQRITGLRCHPRQRLQ